MEIWEERKAAAECSEDPTKIGIHHEDFDINNPRRVNVEL
jgi:hypothetical protein